MTYSSHSHSQQRGRFLVAVSVPVLGAPFLSTVKAGSIKVHPREVKMRDKLYVNKVILLLSCCLGHSMFYPQPPLPPP